MTSNSAVHSLTRLSPTGNGGDFLRTLSASSWQDGTHSCSEQQSVCCGAYVYLYKALDGSGGCACHCLCCSALGYECLEDFAGYGERGSCVRPLLHVLAGVCVTSGSESAEAIVLPYLKHLKQHR